MSYDSNQPKNQGNTKLSEIAIDREIPFLTDSGEQENALVTIENTFKAIAELSRKTNYILHSEGGQITWSGTQLRFDANTLVNSIRMEILATEGSVNSSMSLRLQGGASNTLTTFEYIDIADGELVYLELDSALLVDQGSSFNLENGIDGGSTSTGFRVVKQPMTTAMPKLEITTAGSSSIFSIPLSLRRGNDLLFVPHGIMWPAGTTSQLGAVLVSGATAYPEKFVTNQTELQQAISDLTALGGGIILVTKTFTISSGVVLTSGIKILGRGMNKLSSSVDSGAIKIASGGYIQLADRCILDGLNIETIAGHNSYAVLVNGNYCRIRDCRINLTNSTNNSSTIGALVNGSNNRINDCAFNDVVSTNKIGVSYVGSNNADLDCEDT
jgi:hypothetical protein